MRAGLAYAALFVVLTGIAVAVAADGGRQSLSPSGGPVRGVFFAVESPALTEEELSTLDGLTRVHSVSELEGAIAVDTSLLVIDAAGLSHLPIGFLASRLADGRAIMGINVFGSDLAEAAGFPERDWPTPEQWAQTHAGHGEGAFYSYVYRSAAGQAVQYSGSGQHHFKDRLLPAVLQKLLEGDWREER